MFSNHAAGIYSIIKYISKISEYIFVTYACMYMGTVTTNTDSDLEIWMLNFS